MTINVNRLSGLLIEAKMRSRERRAIEAAEKGTPEEPGSIRALSPLGVPAHSGSPATAAGISGGCWRLTLITSRCKRGLGLEKRLYLRAGVLS